MSAELGTVECWLSRCDVVGRVAVDFRDDLQAAAELLSADDPHRWHLDALLSAIDRALEAKDACTPTAGTMTAMTREMHADDETLTVRLPEWVTPGEREKIDTATRRFIDGSLS